MGLLYSENCVILASTIFDCVTDGRTDGITMAYTRYSIQGGPRKVKPTTILVVTFECVSKIQRFLADVNCIQQEVHDHPNGIIHRV